MGFFKLLPWSRWESRGTVGEYSNVDSMGQIIVVAEPTLLYKVMKNWFSIVEYSDYSLC
jgi:hypothetical protein